MKKQYNQPAISMVEMLPQVTLMASGNRPIQPIIPTGPVEQW